MAALMRLMIVMVVVGLAGGCQQTSDTPTSVVQTIAQVQAGAKKACKFVPDVDPIVKLIPTFGGIASSIINAICSAVNSQVAAAAPGQTLPPVLVEGVSVTGVAVK